MAGFLGDALERRSWRYQTSNPRNPAYWVERLFGGGTMTATGLSIGPEQALSIATILGGVRMVSEDLASCPAPIYLPDPNRPKASIEQRQHPAWQLLNVAPNPEMTAIDLRGTLTGHAMLRGDGWAEKELDQGLRVRALWPLNPDKMRVLRNGVDITFADAAAGDLVYLYTLPNGKEKIFSPELIFHLPGFGGNGIRGYSIVRYMREAMALSLAAEEHGARFYANDATPGMYIKHPGNPTDVAKKNLRDSFEERHRGLSNAHRMAILEEGLSLEKIGMNLSDAEYVATRKFAVEEFARGLRIPITKLTLDHGTYANVEQEDITYMKGLAPWAVRWEQRLALHGVVSVPYYARHTLQALARGDMKTRAEYYHFLRQDGIITGNHVLALEDLPLSDSPAADELLVPMNMRPASSYDEANGMSGPERYLAAYQMARAGYEPDTIITALGLPDSIKHTGFIPMIKTDALDVTDPNASPGIQGGAAIAGTDPGGTNP